MQNNSKNINYSYNKIKIYYLSQLSPNRLYVARETCLKLKVTNEDINQNIGLGIVKIHKRQVKQLLTYMLLNQRCQTGSGPGVLTQPSSLSCLGQMNAQCKTVFHSHINPCIEIQSSFVNSKMRVHTILCHNIPVQPTHVLNTFWLDSISPGLTTMQVIENIQYQMLGTLVQAIEGPHSELTTCIKDEEHCNLQRRKQGYIFNYSQLEEMVSRVSINRSDSSKV